MDVDDDLDELLNDTLNDLELEERKGFFNTQTNTKHTLCTYS